MRHYENGCYFPILCILLSIFCLVSSLIDLNQLIPYKDNLEFCVAEEFKSECPENHIVIITVALYGMMKMERCITIDYGFIGCKSEAIEYLDNLCSGRRNCKVQVPDLVMESYTGCPPSFKSYLNISYSCLEVENRACDMCRYNTDNFALVTHQTASLASIVTEETNQCGSAKCPWRIEVLSGQTINITLFDFGMDSTKKIIADGGDNLMCKRYAVIKEKAHMRDTAICGKTARFQHIYQSVSNIVEIQIVSPAVFLNIGQFVINYKAVGCPDIDPQTNGKVRRLGDKSEIVCMDGQRWEVQCIGNEWKGNIGSCPDDPIPPNPNPLPLSVGLLAAIVIGIALVIAVLIVTIGVVCLKRQHGDRQDTLYVRADQLYELHEPYQGEMTGSLGSMAVRKKVKILPGETVRIAGQPAGRRNFYDVPKNMETRPLPSIPIIEVRAGVRQNHPPPQVAVAASIEEPPQISNENLPPPEPSQFSSFRPKPPQLYTVLDPSEVQQQQTVPPAWGDDPTLAGYFYASSSEGAGSNEASEMPTLLSRQPSQAQQGPNNSSWP